MSAVRDICSSSCRWGISAVQAAWDAAKHLSVRKVVKVALFAFAFIAAAPLVRGAVSGPLRDLTYQGNSSCQFAGTPTSYTKGADREHMGDRAIQLKEGQRIIGHFKDGPPRPGVRIAELLRQIGPFNIPCARPISFRTEGEQVLSGYLSRHEENCRQLADLLPDNGLVDFSTEGVQEMLFLRILCGDKDGSGKNTLACGAKPGDPVPEFTREHDRHCQMTHLPNPLRKKLQEARLVSIDFEQGLNLPDLVGEVLHLPHPFPRALPPGLSFNGLSRSPAYLQLPSIWGANIPSQLSEPLTDKLRNWLDTVQLNELETHRSSFAIPQDPLAELAFDGLLLQILTMKQVLRGAVPRTLSQYAQLQKEGVYEKAYEATVAVLQREFPVADRDRDGPAIRSRGFEEYGYQLSQALAGLPQRDGL